MTFDQSRDAFRAQIIRFPIEHCRPRLGVDIAGFMFAPMFFCLAMATMLVTSHHLWEEPSKHGVL